MNNFETPVSPEKPESFSLEAEKQKEKSRLERFKDKAYKIAAGMLLMSALAGSPGFVEEAEAGQGSKTKIEQLDSTKISASSQWSGRILQQMRNDLNLINSSEDAYAMVNRYCREFKSEFYFPTQGQLTDAQYGVRGRIYTAEDAKFIMQNAQDMEAIIDDLGAKFPDLEFSAHKSQLDDVIVKMKRKASYAGQEQQRILQEIQ